MYPQVLLFICFVVSNTEGKAVFTNKIVGGYPVEISEVPHQLSLQYNTIFICGASLFKYDYALTASHCVTEGNTLLAKEAFVVNAGSKYRTSDISSQLVSVTVHPGYDSNTLSNDIAVLKLASPFQSSNNIKTIPLPSPNYPLIVGAKVITSGWGFIDENAAGAATELRAVEVQIVSRNSCRRTYRFYNTVTNEMICAGVPNGGKDACYGDSGGPLQYRNLLVGIVSWGYGCARSGIPGVYTEVSKYISFIQGCTR